MRISYVELAGFRGFKNTTRFEFPSGFVVLTGRNGAGKSTVLDAIDFVLTGTIDKFSGAKKGGLDSHIWWMGDGLPEKQYAEVGFITDAGEKFAVNRSRDRGLAAPLEDIGARLCKTPLSADWPRTLVQTSLIRDETLASLSMDLPEQARFEAVRTAIGGLTGQDHSGRTADLMAAAKSAKVEMDGKLDQLQEELGRTLTALTEARSVADRQTDVSEAEQIIKRLEPEIGNASGEQAERLRRRIAERKQSIQTLTAAIERSEKVVAEDAYLSSEAGVAEIAAATGRVETLEAAYQQSAAALSTAEALVLAERETDKFASQMVAMLSHGEEIGLIEGHCPLCDAARTDDEFMAAIASARSRLSVRGEAAARSADQLSFARQNHARIEAELEQAQQMLFALSARRNHVDLELGQVRAIFERSLLTAAPSEPDAARQQVLRRQEETAEIERALFILEASNAHDRVSALETRVDQLRVLIEAQTMRSAGVDRALEAAKQIDNAAKTVANQVLTEQFDTVMPLLKELYQRLRPHTDWREIGTDFGGKIRASLNFTVGEGGGKNPQFLFSSGQRRAAGLAFLLAIHLSRPWTTLRSLLLDDPVQHIDDYRALNLVEVLSAVRRLGRQVVVAVEDPALADLLCRRLRSMPGENGRRFDLATGAGGSAVIEMETNILPLPQEILRFAEAS